MAPNTKPSPVFKEGINCWCMVHADRAAVLIDGKAYFEVLADVIHKAQRTIYIAGWDFDSTVELLRDEKHSVTLGECLKQAAERNQDVQIYILVWDWSMIYIGERQWLPMLMPDWNTHDRIHVHLDDEHPMGASHHQKCVIVDDAIAFSGGVDLTKNRWDTPEHRPYHPLRKTPGGKTYGPFHDVQMMVDGEAALALGNLFRKRWFWATNNALSPHNCTDTELWPQSVTPDVWDVTIAIARTLPAYKGRSEIREVLSLYQKTISSAQRYIYIENQYLTSGMITQMLAESLKQEKGPEIVIVVPKQSSGWLEQNSMDTLRNRVICRLFSADQNKRLLILYPSHGSADITVFVHAKICIADDRLLRIGSANLSNRSMGLDSECDLALDAGGDDRLTQAIASVRNRLLSEHLGTSVERVASTWNATQSLIETIRTLARSASDRKLIEINVSNECITDSVDFTAEEDLLDPEKPFKIDHILDGFTYEETPSASTFKLVFSIVLLALLVGLAALLHLTPLSERLEIDTVVNLGSFLKDSVLAPLWVVTGYIFAGLLMVPVTLLIGATGILFPPYWGSLYALMGCLASALTTYGIGAALRQHTIQRLTGKRFNRISRYLAKQGILTIAIARNIPIAPFSIINILAGATHIKLGDFLLGTTLGMLPGILAITFFANRLLMVIKNPSVPNLVLATGIAFLIALGIWWANRRLSRRKKNLAGRKDRTGQPA